MPSRNSSATDKGSNMENKCEKCGKPILAGREVVLELSATDGRYYAELPANHQSQGGFVFGKDCAEKSTGEAVRSYIYALPQL